MVLKRKGWLDVVRTVAIICVVICHADETYYRSVLIGEESISNWLWLIENTLFIIGRIGVPLFLAVTGALVLDREYEDISGFYKKSLLPLFCTTEIWIFFNYVFCCIVKKQIFSVKELVLELFFMKESSLSHMWYMPVILGCYVAIPFLTRLIHNSNIRLGDLRLIYVCGMCIFFIVPTLNVFLTESVRSIPYLSPKIGTSFWGGCYGFYILCGYFIANKKVLQHIRGIYLLILFGISFLLTTFGQYYLYSHRYFKTSHLIWYDSIFVYIMGMVVFELLRRMFVESERIPGQKQLEAISRCSFGVYILHKPLLVLSSTFIKLERYNILLRILWLFVIGFLGSMMILLLVKKYFKRAGRVLFHIK